MKKNTQTMTNQIMTKSLISASVLLLVTFLTGCQTLKETLRPKKALNNHSLDYTKAKKLDPVQLPVDAQTQPFIPMYNVPQTGENTLILKNPKGKNFQLMRPHGLPTITSDPAPTPAPATK